jgi:hypothetical protein
VARWCCTMHPWRHSPFHMMRCYRHQMLAPRRDQGSPAKRGIKTRGALLVAAFCVWGSPRTADPRPPGLCRGFFSSATPTKKSADDLRSASYAPLFRRPFLGARKGLGPRTGLTPQMARPAASPSMAKGPGNGGASDPGPGLFTERVVRGEHAEIPPDSSPQRHHHFPVGPPVFHPLPVCNWSSSECM